MTNGHEPLVHQIDYDAKTNRLTAQILGQTGDLSDWAYRVEVIDSNNSNPAVDSTATPSSGNILATSNPFVTPASASAVMIEFVFTSTLPAGTLVVNGTIVNTTSVP